METDGIGTHHLRAQLGDHLPVDSDHTCLNELVGLATAANAGIGQELVQTNGLVGIEVLLLILNALLQRVLGIGIVVGRMLTETALTLAVATTLLIATLTLLVAALLTLTIATRTLLIATLTLLVTAALLIATLARLIALTTLLTGLIATLTRLIAILTGLIALALTAILIVAWTIATTLLTVVILWLTRLIATLTGLEIIGTRTIAALLGRLALQTGTEALGTEAPFIIIVVFETGTLIARRNGTLPGVNTWTR